MASRGHKLALQAKAAGKAPPAIHRPSAVPSSSAATSSAHLPDFTFAHGEAGRLARRFVERSKHPLLVVQDPKGLCKPFCHEFAPLHGRSTWPLLMLGHPDDVPGGPLISNDAAIFERKQREKHEAAAQADPEEARERRNDEERAADKAVRKEARARKRSERESVDERSVWQQVDLLFAIVQAEARARDQAEATKAEAAEAAKAEAAEATKAEAAEATKAEAAEAAKVEAAEAAKAAEVSPPRKRARTEAASPAAGAVVAETAIGAADADEAEGLGLTTPSETASQPAPPAPAAPPAAERTAPGTAPAPAATSRALASPAAMLASPVAAVMLASPVAAMVSAASGLNWFDGVVRAVHEDGTCDLHNNDGDYEEQVAPQFVKLLATAAATAAEPLSIYERCPHLAPPPERKVRAAVSAAAARERREPRAVAKAAIESGVGYRSIVHREADEAPSSSSRAIGEAAGAAAGTPSPSVSGVYQLSNRAKGSRLRLQKAQSPADT
jgi:hypothetical protein